MDDVFNVYQNGIAKYWRAKPDLPDTLLSRIQLCFSVVIPLGSKTKAEDFYSALVRPPGYDASWTIDSKRSRRRLSIGFHIGDLGATCCDVESRLTFTATRARQLEIRGVGDFALDPMRAMHRVLDQDVDGSTPSSYGGVDSHVRLYADDYPRLFGIQLDLLNLVCRELVAILARAAGCEPSSLQSRIWVQSLELCRDYRFFDAADMVRCMARVPPAGAWGMKPKYITDRSRNSICVSWNNSRAGTPVRKAYALDPCTVRTAVEVRSRGAIGMLIDAARTDGLTMSDYARDDVARSLVDIARACRPILNALWLSLDTAERSRLIAKEAHEFVEALGPLMRLRARAPRARDPIGRERQARARAEARSAIECLVTGGMFDAGHLSADDEVLKALRETAARNGIVAKMPEPRIFMVDHKLEFARRALVQVRHTPQP